MIHALHQNFKIIIAVLIAFIISLSLLIFGLSQVESQIVPINFQKKFYGQDFLQNEDKISI